MLVSKDPATMTARAINRELDALETLSRGLGDELIAAGRGHETWEMTRLQRDELSLRCHAESARRFSLRYEIERRYGPGAPSRLPETRMFGPRKTA